MGVHRDCGEQITWTRREDGTGWAPPLEFAGHQYVLREHPTDPGSQIAVRESVYKIHQCDPDKVLAWREYKARLAEIEAKLPAVDLPQTDWEVKRERDREERWNATLPYPCTDCGVGAGEYCIHLGKGPRAGQPLRNPHFTRVALSEEHLGKR